MDNGSNMNYESQNEEVNKEKAQKEESQFIYQTVMKGKQSSRAFSITSLVLSVLSLVCCCSSWISLVLGCLGIVFAVFSRKNIGYFDGLSLAGLVVGIFGAVFGAMGLVFEYILVNTDFYKELMLEIESYLEDALGDSGPTVAPGDGSFV